MDKVRLKNIQNDLFDMGFDPGKPDGILGYKTAMAIRLFQSVAGGDLRIFQGSQIGVERTFNDRYIVGELDDPTITEIQTWIRKGYRFVDPDDYYSEKRVRASDYPKATSFDPPLFSKVPGPKGSSRILHTLAAQALKAMAESVKSELGIDLIVQSGCRRHRWQSWDHYKEYVTKKYGNLQRGRRYLAYNSPHETGLAVDFGSGGLFPRSKTIPQQRKTKLWEWLCKKNAWRYGWRPYKAEPWHWEFPLSQRAWETGELHWLPGKENENG